MGRHKRRPVRRGVHADLILGETTTTPHSIGVKRSDSRDDELVSIEDPETRTLLSLSYCYFSVNNQKLNDNWICIGAFSVLLHHHPDVELLNSEFWFYLSEKITGTHFLYFTPLEERPVTVKIELINSLHADCLYKMSLLTSILKLKYDNIANRQLRIQVFLSTDVVVPQELLSNCSIKLSNKIMLVCHSAYQLCHYNNTEILVQYTDIDLLLSPPHTSDRGNDFIQRISEIKYDTFQPAHRTTVKTRLANSALRPTLRSYQISAVQWMLYRETCADNTELLQTLRDMFKPLTQTIRSYIKYRIHEPSGLIIENIQSDSDVMRTAGGILCDEMGLGKTIEIIAVVLCNPHSTNNEHLLTASDDTIYAEQISNTKHSSKQFISQTTNNATVKKSSPNPIENGDTETKGLMDETRGDKEIEINVSESFLDQISDRLECVCGDERKSIKTVKCSICSLQQHADCVGFTEQHAVKQSYLCPYCISLQPAIEGRSSLIIVPASIRYQWVEEIEKHVDTSCGLRVVVYDGVSVRYIQPLSLASCDIVITTYETLLREVNFTSVIHSNDIVNGRRMRSKRRFLTAPSPLLSVYWWRICLDEAQMVEKAMSKSAVMCLKLKSVHRWCVTGTPIQVGVNDLYGLLLFLGVAPFNNKQIWESVIYRPYCNGDSSYLINLMKHYMWRTNMSDVREQLGVSEIIETVHYTEFTPVEEVFYRRQYTACKTECLKLLTKIQDQSVRLDQIDRGTLSDILISLLSMRQACCHPSVVKNQHAFTHNLSLDELLPQITKSVNTDCEEAQRRILAGLNGQAACHIMEGKIELAIRKYRKALEQSKRYSTIRTDPLQLIHTVTNLREMLLSSLSNLNKSTHSNVETCHKNTTDDESLQSPPNNNAIQDITTPNPQPNSNQENTTLNSQQPDTQDYPDVAQLDESIEITSQASTSRGNRHLGIPSENKEHQSGIPNKEKTTTTDRNIMLRELEILERKKTTLSSEYLDKTERSVSQLLLNVIQLEKQIHQHQLAERSRYKDGKLMGDNYWFCTGLQIVGTDHTLLSTINTNLDIPSFTTVNGLLYYIVNEWEKLFNLYRETTESIHQLHTTKPTPSIIQQVVSCCLNSEDDNIKRNKRRQCMFCDSNDLLLKYERRLYRFSRSYIDMDGETRYQGNWGDSVFEVILKFVQRYLHNSLGSNSTTVIDAKNHLQLIDAMKKHFKPLRGFWVVLRERISAVDELKMAELRFRLREEGEEISNVRWIVEKYEIEELHHKQVSQQLDGESNLEVHLRQLNYMKSLANQAIGKTGENTEICPICTSHLGRRWVVLKCCHQFCVECITVLLSRKTNDISVINSLTTGTHRSVKCAVCRAVTLNSDISYVSTENSNTNSEKSQLVKGNLSSKITEVVYRIKLIERSDSHSKILLFSRWTSVLDVIQEAFNMNDIVYTRLSGSKSAQKYHKNLQLFKTQSGIEVLLMPVSFGANGLNLIEANHVMFMEPLINLGVEAQAIGRIVRIGQTRQPHVHRFIVSDSIEQRIHTLISETSKLTNRADEIPLTVNDLHHLFN